MHIDISMSKYRNWPSYWMKSGRKYLTILQMAWHNQDTTPVVWNVTMSSLEAKSLLL
jgi:hypothetical protein